MMITTYPGKAVMPDAYQTSAAYPSYYPTNPYNNEPYYNSGNMYPPGYNYQRY